MQLVHLKGNPLGLGLGGRSMVVQDRGTGGQRGDQVLFDAVPVFRDQGIDHIQDLGRRAVILHHQDGPGAGKMPVKLQQILHIGTAPGIDRLVRVPDHEKVLMVIT